MRSSHSKQRCLSQFSCLRWLTGIVFLTITKTCAANVIELHGELSIDKPVKYTNVTLNMTDGRFNINAGGTLDIENSTINLTISADNPYFVNQGYGSLILKNNKVNVSVNHLIPNANTKSSYQLISVKNGNVKLDANQFSNDVPFTLQFFESMSANDNGINISNNYINNFHGGVYLSQSQHANITGNSFMSVSNTNIVNMGNTTNINRNIFLLSGFMSGGNTIEVVNSKDVTITENVIMSSYKYGIYLRASQNTSIDNNKISDGSSYAIFIDSPVYARQDMTKQAYTIYPNNHISITNNYLSQNKYGIAGKQVDYLTVSNNYFIQRFSNNKSRQYWTDNKILLPLVTNMVWSDNLYKEAFTQEVPGDNSNTLKFVIFPQMGGVVLP